MEPKNYISKEPFVLESGERLPQLQIRYHTYGKLNAERNNVIWVCHALTANSAIHDWWAELFGPGNVFDPEKYFIVCANNLGSPNGTTSPDHHNPINKKRYGLSFPFITIRDTAKVIIELIDHLEINGIQMLIGGSCGGNIALEIAFFKQGFIKNLVLLCSSVQEKPWTIAIHHSQRIALSSDKDFSTNRSGVAVEGLKSARAFALPFYRNSISMNHRQKEDDNTKLNNFKASSYITYQGEKFVKRFDAHCYYVLLNALDTHNLGRGRNGNINALENIKSKTLVLGINSDLFIPPTEQQFLATHIPNATYKEINSIYGHDAFLIETEQIRNFIIEAKIL